MNDIKVFRQGVGTTLSEKQIIDKLGRIYDGLEDDVDFLGCVIFALIKRIDTLESNAAWDKYPDMMGR